MYNREPRYRSMAQATPWTVGPSISGEDRPPAAALADVPSGTAAAWHRAAPTQRNRRRSSAAHTHLAQPKSLAAALLQLQLRRPASRRGHEVAHVAGDCAVVRRKPVQ